MSVVLHGKADAFGRFVPPYTCYERVWYAVVGQLSSRSRNSRGRVGRGREIRGFGQGRQYTGQDGNAEGSLRGVSMGEEGSEERRTHHSLAL